MHNKEELAAAQWDAQKKVLAIVAQQQQMIGELFARYYGLVDLLRTEAGLNSRPSERSEETRKQLAAEIADLERLFAAGGEPTHGATDAS